MLNLFQPSLGQDELEEVEEVFRSNWIGYGPKVAELETTFATYLGIKPEYIVSTTCATEGLFAILDMILCKEVLLPSISFVGAANAIVSAGAKPVFCDVDVRILNPTADTIRAALTPRTGAIVLLHYGGLPCPMDEILDLCDQYGLLLIEDSSCSLGSKYMGRHCGTMGSFGVWSLDAMKTISAGDGGLIYCRNKLSAEVLRRHLNLGLTVRRGYDGPQDRWWEFNVTSASRRAIMNDITAAIGLVQLGKLDSYIRRRLEISAYYNKLLLGLPWLLLPPTMAPYFYWVRTSYRDQLARFLRQREIYTSFRYNPLHRIPFYRHDGRKLPNTELVAETTLLLPLHQSLSDHDIERVCEAIHDFGRLL